jgi:hypothetical protein
LAQRYLKSENLALLDKIPLLGYMGSAYEGISQYELAEKAFAESVQYAHQMVPVFPRLYSLLHNFSYVKQEHLKYLDAKQLLLESCELAHEVNNHFQIVHSGIELAGVLTELGEYEQAENYLTQAREFLQKRETSFLTFQLEACTNLLYRSWSQLSQSKILAIKYGQSTLDNARKIDDGSKIQQALHYLAQAEIANGNAQRALELVKELEKFALENTSENPYNTYVIPWNKGLILELLGKKEEAKNLLVEAYKLATGINNHLYAYKIALELDRLNNDLESARQHMQWFEERGLLNGVNIAKRYFPELATDPPPVVVTPEELPRLDVLGVMQLRLGNRLESVRGSKRQEFLALLLEAKLSGRSEVGNLQLLDLLYPDQDEMKALSNLRALVNSLRDFMGASAITTTASGYALGHTTSDAERFLETGDTSLWRDVYLQGLSIDGQETVQESLYLMLFEKAKGLLETNPKETARVARILLEADPYDQEYLRLCTQALRVSNNHKSLSRLYADSRVKLAEVGEMLPESWQHFLSA